MFAHSRNRRTAEALSSMALLMAVLAIALVAISAESDAEASYYQSGETLIIIGDSEETLIESEAVEEYKGGVSEVVLIGNFDIGESAFQDWTGLRCFVLDANGYDVEVLSKAFSGCTDVDYMAFTCSTIGLQDDSFEGCNIAQFAEWGTSKNISEIDQQLYNNNGAVEIVDGAISASIEADFWLQYEIFLPNDFSLGDVSRHLVVSPWDGTYNKDGDKISVYDAFLQWGVEIEPTAKDGAYFVEWDIQSLGSFQSYVFTAEFASGSGSFDITVAPNNDTYGTVSQNSFTVPYGTSYCVSGNILTVGDYTVEAAPICNGNFVNKFVSWGVESGTVTSDLTFTASFSVSSFEYGNVVYQVDSNKDLMVMDVVNDPEAVVLEDAIEYGGEQFTPMFIDYNAFDNCPSLKSVYLGKLIIENHTNFEKCPLLASITVSEDNTEFASVAGVLYDKDVTKLIRFPEGKQRLIIPDTVTEICERAFFEAGVGLINSENHFRYVNIPGTVTTVGDSAFENSALEVLKFNDGTTDIGMNAFKDCDCLTYVLFNDTIENIGENAFDDMFYDENGNEMDIEEAVCGYKFTGDSQILLRYVPKEGASIHDGTYVYRIVSSGDDKKVSVLGFEKGATSESVVIDENVSYLGFDWSVEKVVSKAFMGDAGIKSVKVSCDVGFKAFANCTSIIQATLYGYALGDYAFFGCTSLETVEVEDCLETIGTSAFSGCSSLSSIDTQYFVDIGRHAFYGCALTDVDLSCVGSIGYGAFTGNDIQSVTFGQDLSEIDSKSFFRYTFKDANGEKLGITANDLVGKTFAGTGKVLTQSA